MKNRAFDGLNLGAKSDLSGFEIERANIFKRLKILKFLAFLEALAMAFLAFVASKDLIIALCIGVFVGAIFYKMLARRLLARQSAIENELLAAFLRQNGGKFTPFNENFEKTPQNFPLLFANFKLSNAFEFEDFTIYDIRAQNAANRTFMGILLVLKGVRFKANLKTISENEIFAKLYFKGFCVDKIYIKDDFSLIATLSNPFFVDKRLNLSENLEQMRANLEKIRDLFV